MKLSFHGSIYRFVQTLQSDYASASGAEWLVGSLVDILWPDGQVRTEALPPPAPLPSALTPAAALSPRRS